MNLQQIFQSLLTSKEVLAALVAALLAALGWFFLRNLRGRVAWGVSGGRAFNLQNLNPPTIAYIKEVWIQNVGREVATEVEIIFPFKPVHFNVWPFRPYSEFANPDNSYVIKLENLNPREFATISCFSTGNAPPDVSSVRWHGGVAKQVQMGPQQIFPRWWVSILQFLVIVGFTTVMYGLARALMH